MSVLVTGGAGFIGSRLSLALLARGHRVRVLDSLSPQIHGVDPSQSTLYRSIAGKLDFRRGDVTRRDHLEWALAGIDTVIHLAAENGPWILTRTRRVPQVCARYQASPGNDAAQE